MIQTITRNDNHATECAECGRLLINPGYHKQHVFCCGKYRRWYDVAQVTITRDNGRDEHGRFHHRPAVLSRERVVLDQGGK